MCGSVFSIGRYDTVADSLIHDTIIIYNSAVWHFIRVPIEIYKALWFYLVLMGNVIK